MFAGCNITYSVYACYPKIMVQNKFVFTYILTYLHNHATYLSYFDLSYIVALINDYYQCSLNSNEFLDYSMIKLYLILELI